MKARRKYGIMDAGRNSQADMEMNQECHSEIISGVFLRFN
jgi:hypothetical protein